MLSVKVAFFPSYERFLLPKNSKKGPLISFFACVLVEGNCLNILLGASEAGFIDREEFKKKKQRVKKKSKKITFRKKGYSSDEALS